MNHTKTRDVAELVSLLESELEAYQLLLSLSVGQAAAFTDAGARGLMKVIAKKQEVITRIRMIDEELLPYTSNWDATRRVLPGPIRRVVSNIATAVADLIGQIIESEHAIEGLVAAARDRAGRTARTVAGGLKAARAYRLGELAEAGGILDGEG